MYISVAVDVVFQGLKEPSRFLHEAKVRIFPKNETFWNFGKRVMTESFTLTLCEHIRERKNSESKNLQLGEQYLEFIQLESTSQHARRMSREQEMNALRSPKSSRTWSSESEKDRQADKDLDEPLMSGAGDPKGKVDEQAFFNWAEVMQSWRTPPGSPMVVPKSSKDQRSCSAKVPEHVRRLVPLGVPEMLRKEVWSRLAGCSKASAEGNRLEHQYTLLWDRDCPLDQVIERDLNRTFPAHPYFQSELGQQNLYSICRAYALYDTEVSYCQGLSFLAAGLLLYMDPPESFTLLVKIMFNYGMREMFQNGFNQLQACFYKMELSTMEFLPDIHEHFTDIGCEPHISQWFLTLFTAKFPLNFVFRVLDWFLLDGMPVIFRIAIALLRTSRKELSMLDFEGVLRFFRVQLPKRFLDDEKAVETLFSTARSIKITHKKLAEYQKMFDNRKADNLKASNPELHWEQKYNIAMKRILHLEAENDFIAGHLAREEHRAAKVEQQLQEKFQEEQTKLIETAHTLNRCEQQIIELADENKIFEIESRKVKDTCREEMERQESEIGKLKVIVEEYKVVTSRLSSTVDQQKTKLAGMSPVSGNSPNADSSSESKEYRLEVQLAKCKLDLVESQCKVQELEHKLSESQRELKMMKERSWISRLTKKSDG